MRRNIHLNTHAALVLAVAGGATAANAQVQMTSGGNPVIVSYSFTMTEVDPVNFLPVASPNGVVEPGEGARLQLTASISPVPGSAVSYPASLLAGSSGSGLIQGFWAGAIDILVDEGAPTGQGTWTVSGGTGANGRGVRFPYDAAGVAGNGTTTLGGARLMNIQPAIFTPSVEGVPSASPTVALWRGVWVPSDYSARNVTFTSLAASVGIWPALIAARDNNGLSLPVAGNAEASFDSITIFVPSPSSLALLGLGGLIATGRRRR